MKETFITELDEARQCYNELFSIVDNQVTTGKLWLGKGQEEALGKLERIGEFEERSTIEIIQKKIQHLNDAVDLTDDLENALAEYIEWKEKYLVARKNDNRVTAYVERKMMLSKRQDVIEIKSKIYEFLAWI